MRIALDATYSVGNQLTGIGVYSNRLIRELVHRHPQDRFLLCYRAKHFREAYIPELPNVRKRLLQPPLPLFGADLFHSLNQRVDKRPAQRVVSTFHDLFVMTSDYSTPEFRSRFTNQAKSAAANSDLLIAVSHFTAFEVESLLGVDRSRIRVVPHGVDIPELLDESVREKTVLFVGALQSRKNLIRLVKAFEALPNDWKLVLAGSPNGYGAADIMTAIKASPARKRISVTGHIPDGTLHWLLRTASIFAFPSLDEGFGIPVLEAMAYGVPVVTSNRSALREVAGDAAILVDPTRVDEIEYALTLLANDSEQRTTLATLGRNRAKEFTWSKTAELTYAVYRELA